MDRCLFLAPLLALAACTTPPAAGPGCPADAARELATLDRLSAESTRALATGYRDEPRPARSGFNLCLGSGHDNVGVSFCTGGGNGTQRVAIDPDAEQRKLDSLAARRAAILQQNPACTAAT